MATVCKVFIHNREDLVSTDGNADGKLAEDIQDYIDLKSLGDSDIDLCVSHCDIDDSRVMTSVTIANTTIP